MSPTGKSSRKAHIFCSTLLVSLLAACGGSSAPITGVPTVAPVANVTISGTAATGAPIFGGTVRARCQGGTTASTVTQSNGNYSMSVVIGAMPCAIQVAPTGGGQVLYSMASGTAATVTANITPLTSLALAQSVNTTTALTLDAWFASVSSLPAVATALAGAQTTLRTALVAAGYTVPTPFDPISTIFSPAAGNAYDDLLEAIAAGIRAAGGSFAATQTSFVAGGGVALPARASTSTPTTTTTVTPSTGLGNTVAATLNAALLGTYTKAFYGDGAGCGSACSFTEGQTVSFSLSGNVLSLQGKILSNPYNRILQGTTTPHTPEIIWRDGNIEYALTNNATGTFTEINVGDISAPTAQGLPKFLGQIREVSTPGISNVTKYAGTYARSTQYFGPTLGTKRPLWTSVTIRADGAILFDGGDSSSAGDLGPTVSASNMTTINDFSRFGKVQILLNVDVNGDGAVNQYDQIRLFNNAVGQLTSIEYDVSSSNYVGMLLGTPAALPAQGTGALPTTDQIAGTALGSANVMGGVVGGAYSQLNQGGFSITGQSGQNSWSINANHQAPMSSNAVFNCQVPDTNTNRDVTLTLTLAGNIYRSTEGGRCQITLTNVTFANGVVASVEGRFVAELFRPERNLAPLVINDGVFRWVRP